MNSESLLITHEYVRQALDALIHIDHKTEFNPLQSLQIVETCLMAADFTFFAYPRHFALNELLISIIENQYMHHRYVHRLADTKTVVNISEVEVSIAEDALTQNADLIGWSWLYFHYVKTNIHISQDEFSKLSNLDKRTIRRYQNRSIDQLVNYLIKQEQDSRQKYFINQLYTQLPHKGKEVSLFGREQEIKLIQQNPKRHCHVMGSAGIGKSIFVEHIVREKINQGEVDYLIWLDSIPHLEYLQTYLYEKLIGDHSNYNVEAYISIKRIVIVLDNCESLFQDISSLQQLLLVYSPAQIFLITNSFYGPLIEAEQIVLKELPLSAIEMMVEQIARSNNDLEHVNSVTDIKNWTGGNPLAIKTFLQYRSFYNVAISNQLTVDQLYTDQFSQLALSTRLAWLVISINYDSHLRLTHLANLALSNLDFQDFLTLIRFHILEDRLGELSMSISARHFIRLQYLADRVLQQALSGLLSAADSFFYKSKYLCLILMESVLPIDWLLLDQTRKQNIAKLLWRFGIDQGHYAQWHLILGEYADNISEENVNLLIGYGICLRRLGDLELSRKTLLSVIKYCGLNGLFEYQCEALLDMCIVSRYTSNYEDVFHFLKHVKILSKTIMSSQLNERILLEEIEFAIETNEWDFAQSRLFDLPDHHPRKAILQLEIYANYDIDDSQIDDHIILFLEKIKEYTPDVARMHILIGRIYEERHEIKLATSHFMAALALLEQNSNDPFALARTQTNLAGMLLASDQLDGVVELLQAAEHTQRVIGDQLGLVATLHNNRVLASKIVS